MNIEKLNIIKLCVQEKQKKDKGLFEDPLNKQHRVHQKNTPLKLQAGAAQNRILHFNSAFRV